MIEIVFALSLTVSLMLYMRRRVLRHAPVIAGDGFLLHRPLGDDRKRHLLFVSGLLEFTVPLAIASGVYTLLDVWLRNTARTEAATTIATIEKTLAAIRNTYVKPFHLSPLTQLLLVLALAMAGVVWPQLQKHEVLGGFKRFTKWSTRAYILATLLVSFTFFGSVYSDHARAVEVHLAEEIDAIERVYGQYQKELAGVVEDRLAAVVVSNPGYAPAVADLETVARDFTSERAEKRATREAIARYPKIELADFELLPEAKPSAATSAEHPREPSASDTREDWNRRDGTALRDEAAILRSEAQQAGFQSAEVFEAGFDLAQEHLGEAILSSLLRDGAVVGVLKLAIDPAVLYAYRDVAAKQLDAIFRASLARRIPLRELVVRHTAAARTRLEASVASAAQEVRASAAACRVAWRDRARDARQMHAAIGGVVQQRAEEQFARERDRVVREWRARYIFPTDDMNVRVGRLFDRIDRMPSAGSPLERVAELRDVASAGSASDTAGVAARRLAAVESELFPGSTPYGDALEASVQEILATNRATRWGWLRHEAARSYRASAMIEVFLQPLADGMSAWQAEEQRQAYELVAAGAQWPEANWERLFTRFCERHPETVVAWGWRVKDTHHRQVEARYERAIPEYGYSYYLEETGQGARFDARAVFARKDVNELVGGVCDRLSGPGTGSIKSGLGFP